MVQAQKKHSVLTNFGQKILYLPILVWHLKFRNFRLPIKERTFATLVFIFKPGLLICLTFWLNCTNLYFNIRDLAVCFYIINLRWYHCSPVCRLTTTLLGAQILTPKKAEVKYTIFLHRDHIQDLCTICSTFLLFFKLLQWFACTGVSSPSVPSIAYLH